MRILAYISGHNGATYHRVTLPLNMLADQHGIDICTTNNPTADYGFEKGCDIFMWNRILPEGLFEALPALKEKYGFRTCCDLDDHWGLDEHHPLYAHYKEVDFVYQQIRHIQRADIVFVTHERLANAVRDYNPNVEVLPNAIPRTGQFDIERSPSNAVRLFWQGSDTHEEDIAILQRPLGALGPISGKMKMVMAGVAEDSHVWYKMARIYTADFKTQYKLITGASVLGYYEMYKEADVCLVPLVRSQFNSFKSNLKVLEAANMELPVIASMVDPYLDLPIFYCQKGRDWIRHISDLVQSRRKREEAGQELAEFCAEHYNFTKINEKRNQIFEYETSKAS